MNEDLKIPCCWQFHFLSGGVAGRVSCPVVCELNYCHSASCVPHNVLLLLLLSHFSRVRLCATPQTAAHQAPPSLGFSRQERWSGLPFPSSLRESEK